MATQTQSNSGRVSRKPSNSKVSRKSRKASSGRREVTDIEGTDLFLFNEGRQSRAYQKWGAHRTEKENEVRFTVWVPFARSVSVVGDFNGWDSQANPLESLGNSGSWSGTALGVTAGQAYKYRIVTSEGKTLDKADPFAFYSEVAPKTASRISDLQYQWNDQEWMQKRGEVQNSARAISVYEMHLGSWKRGEDQRYLTYKELAEELPRYLKDMNFTHVQFMPVMEHPFYGSWGYQTTGYFSPTARYGTPEDFMHLIDCLHQAGFGVFLDWVPSHFPSDEFALAQFNGTPLFEHPDPRKGYHPDWQSLIFDYGRPEVRSFLISSAMFWLDKYHIDGLRVDAVASMLYLDYSRKPGEWIPNIHGGRENLEAVHFLRELNQTVYQSYPDIHMIAEESTAWPGVSAPVYLGGLGFGMKWDMGWMHDTLEYYKKDPLYRSHHQGQLSFRMVYAFSENFVLSISHDEVVYGKGSVIGKMAGDSLQKFANARNLYAYMYAQPGKKLLFMGSEFGQFSEWAHEKSLDWHLTEQEGLNKGLQAAVRDLNLIYAECPALHAQDFSGAGFEWLDASDSDNCVFSFFRKDTNGRKVLCVFNMTPVVRYSYRLGVTEAGKWKEIFNSDDSRYGGSGLKNENILTQDILSHGRPYSIDLTLPPLAALYLELDRGN